jgi:hypothetical protein
MDIGLGMFAINDNQPLVTDLAGQNLGFRFYLFQAELRSFCRGIAAPETAQ